MYRANQKTNICGNKPITENSNKATDGKHEEKVPRTSFKNLNQSEFKTWHYTVSSAYNAV